MSGQNNPEFSHPDPNEELTELEEFNKRGCCFWLPSFHWQRISTNESQCQSQNRKEESQRKWWDVRKFNAVKKVREWSELVAGPKWKTFIRRFNNNKNRSSKENKFNYDPLSYSLNFDDGPLESDDRLFRDFSSRFASIPVSAKSSMDLGKDPPSFL